MADTAPTSRTATSLLPPEPEAAGVGPTSAPEGAPEGRAQQDDPLARARTLLAAHPVADGFNGLARALHSLPWYDIELGESALDTDLPRLRAGGVGAQFWSLHTAHPAPRGADDDTDADDCAVGGTLERIDRVQALVRSHSEGFLIARTAEDAADARSRGRVASFLGPAPAAAIGDSLGTLRALRDLGVHSLTLAGARWTRDGRGLTRFGVEVVREMNRCGMLVDLSGATEETTYAVLAAAKAPVLFAHSGARALTDHPANVPDDVLAALGAARGLCMVGFAADRTGPRLADVADHLDHVRALAGPHAVGLSGGYDTGRPHPDGLPDAAAYPHLIAELLTRGWPDADIALLTWGNVQRVLREAEFTARALSRRRGPSTARIDELDQPIRPAMLAAESRATKPAAAATETGA
ncbi:dipeptidase [Streptomyces sp. NPDC060194]|uniref:dipeptidase n=1 Tax=Streptomyces sp. NPDC060194 TaxID=3347069 RepID=UPI003668DCD2